MCGITASPPAEIASALPVQTPPSHEASICDGPVDVCVFSVVIIPEESHLIDAKSNFAPAILNLMRAKSNLEVGSAPPLTHLADLYIFI